MHVVQAQPAGRRVAEAVDNLLARAALAAVEQHEPVQKAQVGLEPLVQYGVVVFRDHEAYDWHRRGRARCGARLARLASFVRRSGGKVKDAAARRQVVEDVRNSSVEGLACGWHQVVCGRHDLMQRIQQGVHPRPIARVGCLRHLRPQGERASFHPAATTHDDRSATTARGRRTSGSILRNAARCYLLRHVSLMLAATLASVAFVAPTPRAPSRPAEPRHPPPAARFSTDRRALLAAACAACTLPLPPQAALATDVETKSPFIAFAKNFLPSESAPATAAVAGPLDAIAWDAPKRTGLSTEQMADAINDGLREREWFVTGKGIPALFSDKFTFSDPDVSLDGYEPYCRQVARLFDQPTARCEVICCSATAPNTITVAWRNSGKVTIGALGIDLKPYVVTTTLRTDPADGLIVSQSDEFSSDGLGLLLYQVPQLRSLAGPPAPSVEVLRQQCDFKTCTGKFTTLRK